MKTADALPNENENNLPTADDLIGKKGLCPICGIEVSVIGITKDGRPIGSCKDAFTVKQWIED
jgi:hypothetical protein